jgi:hypothetical protein
MAANKHIKDHPAFPVSPFAGDGINPRVRGNSGMSMLDFFAGCAAMGLLSGLDNPNTQALAKVCYDAAEDLMLERQTRYNSATR